MLENEFSFLVTKLPDDWQKHPRAEIKQGYYSDLPSPLRLRAKDEKYSLTKKIPVHKNDFSRYQEMEMPIKKEEFDRLWPVCKKSLTKTRIFYPLSDNLTAELDIYHGPLEGLATVEVEFPTEELRTKFNQPDWFGADITQEDWSANSQLCDLTLAQIQTKIKALK